MNRKQVIRLTESQFHQIVKETIDNVMNEGLFDKPYVPGEAWFDKVYLPGNMNIRLANRRYDRHKKKEQQQRKEQLQSASNEELLEKVKSAIGVEKTLSSICRYMDKNELKDILTTLCAYWEING